MYKITDRDNNVTLCNSRQYIKFAMDNYENIHIVEYSNGEKRWYLNGKNHREDGPAIESFNGDKLWFLNGVLHREDGPAIEYVNGDKRWFLNGEEYQCKSINDFKNIVKTLIFA